MTHWQSQDAPRASATALYIDSINQNDYNVLMADMSLYTLIGLLSGVFLDLSYGFIDPRIRMGAKK